LLSSTETLDYATIYRRSFDLRLRRVVLGLMIQLHQPVGFDRRRSVSLSSIVAEFDFVDAAREILNNGANLTATRFFSDRSSVSATAGSNSSSAFSVLV
jgi:hypothetical protein